MKTFLVSMTLVTVSILLVAALKTNPKVSSRNTPSKHKVLNSLTSHFQQDKKPTSHAYRGSRGKVATTVRKTTADRMAKRLGSKEKLEIKNVRNQKSFSVSAKDLKMIAPGTYVAKYKNKYYKINNVRKPR